MKSKTYYYEYFGEIISVFLVTMYFIKVFYLVPKTDDKGEIIPHILCFKIMSTMIYPVYGEYLNYCRGYSLLDFPWLNNFFSQYLTI
jgi:hypothetical protein